MKHILFVPAFVLLAATAFVGCSDDKKEPDPLIPATSVVVDVTEKDLHVGDNLQLTVTLTPANTTDKVQWTSEDPATATVSEKGLVTAVALGSTSVKAVCGEVSATCVIRVVEPDPSELYDIISFEEEEGMTDIGGQKVTLGDIEVVGGFAEGVYSNVFWAKPYAEYGDPEGIMGLTIDLPLFTSDNNVWFGSYYCDCTGWGQQLDTWGGFVLSRNCNTTASLFDYADQFSVYAESGANDSKTFAVAYCNAMMGGDYSGPTIVFTTTPRKVAYLYMAPSTMLYTYYKYDSSAAADRTYSYRITGWLKGESRGTVDVELVKNSTVAEGWVKVDLTSLGEVDKLTFAPEGINPNRDLDPVYFCLDEIALVK